LPSPDGPKTSDVGIEQLKKQTVTLSRHTCIAEVGARLVVANQVDVAGVESDQY